MQPWKILLPDNQPEIIYREWGVFYFRRQKLDIAANYYNASLELKDDPKAFFSRSRCKRAIAQTEGALLDARTAMASDPLRQPYNLEVCDALYQLNAFEKSKCEIFNNSRKFKGLKLKAFHYRHDVLEANFMDTLGPTLGPFILEQEKYFMLAFEKLQREMNIDPRPLWKILKEQNKCDVLSVLEIEKEIISPREFARRRRAFNVFNQLYMRQSWIDVLFLRALKKNPNLLLHQSQWTRPQLEYLTKTKYRATVRFMRMLHARNPMYTLKLKNCPNKKLSDKSHNDFLFRVQYQIHRDMLAMLRKMKHLRETNQLGKLTKYVEEVMGEYVVLKTRRVMPWKFEFLNEVYNILALAYLDWYVDTPQDLAKLPLAEQLKVLLRIGKESDNEPRVFVFGDRSTHQDQNAGDYAMHRHKQYIAQLENRVLFARYSIEKAYLFHQIAAELLKETHYNECCVVARKSIDASKKCNSFVWMLLGLLLVCKSYAGLGTIERILQTLVDIRAVVKQLDSDKVKNFMALLQKNVRQLNAAKKKAEAESAMRKMKSRMSIQSG